MDFAGVLVGLGNPGSKYENTRHNAGFLLVDALLDLAYRDGQVSQSSGTKFSCDLWRVQLKELGGTWLVAKPMTFMNLSGQCVQPLLAWHRLSPSQLVVVHDELDIPVGAVRFKLGGGNAGHNGLKSINQLLGTPDFYRLRIGIGRPPQRGDVSNWVLGRMDAKDNELWQDAIAGSLEVLFSFASKGLQQATATATKVSKRIAAAHMDVEEQV